jgi:hypothetical protein
MLFQHAANFTDTTHDGVGYLAPSGFSVIGPNGGEISFCLWRPSEGRLGPTMAPVHLIEELFDIERLAFAGVERM